MKLTKREKEKLSESIAKSLGFANAKAMFSQFKLNRQTKLAFKIGSKAAARKG